MDSYVTKALEQGIEQVWQDMADEWHQQITVWRAGKVVWPQSSYMKLSRDLPYWLPEFRQDEYYYRSEEQCAYFHYGNHAGNIIEFSAVSEAELAKLTASVAKWQAALDLFETIAGEADKINQGVQQKMMGKLLQSSAKVQEIFSFLGVEIAPETTGRILVGRCAEGRECTPELFDRLKKSLPKIMPDGWLPPVLWEGRILWFFFPEVHRHEVETYAAQWSAMAAEDSAELSWGLGSVYDGARLYRSYLEANVAWALGSLRGGKTLCAFRDLGIEQLLFSQEVPALRSYVQQTFAALWENDRQEEQQLFLTLQRLVRSDFSMAKTAEALFLHVNTVRYRCNKIEALLGMSLDSYQARTNLIAAFTIWEVLREIGVMN